MLFKSTHLYKKIINNEGLYTMGCASVKEL